MMEVHLSAQVHVLTGLGYPPTEQGIAMYNYQLSELMSTLMPGQADKLQRDSRDLWRTTLGLAFNLPLPEDEGEGKVAGDYDELDVQQARELMYDVSVRMGSKDFLEILREEAGNISKDDMKRKHTKIQELLIEKVYFGDMAEEADCIVSRFSNGKNRTMGYVVLQSLMAKHQSDPLISQYVGQAMMKVFEASGIDEKDVRAQATSQ